MSMYKMKDMEIDNEMTQEKKPVVERRLFRKENRSVSRNMEMFELKPQHENLIKPYLGDEVTKKYTVVKDLLETHKSLGFSKSNQSALNEGKLLKLISTDNQFFSSSFHSLIHLDEKLCIKSFSSAANNQVNIRKSDIGRPLSDLTNSIININLEEEIKSAFDFNKTLYKQVEVKSGKWYSLLIEPFSRSNGTTEVGVNIAFHDITELSLSKLKVDMDYIKLLKINSDHENFIYSVSHDLKSPLNNLEGLVSLMINAKDDQNLKKFGAHLLNSVKGLRQTVNELSDIANIEKDLNGEDSIDLSTLIEEIKLSLSNPLLESFAILREELEVKQINFSKKNLRSIILNFLSNAIKYKSNNRQLKIEIKTRKEADRVVLSIMDNGIGISDDEIKSIFSKFKRITAGEDIEGAGIGLFLVNRIVTNAGGELKVKSFLGKGSNFEVHFPNLKSIGND